MLFFGTFLTDSASRVLQFTRSLLVFLETFCLFTRLGYKQSLIRLTKTHQGWTRLDKTGQDWTRLEKTGQDWTRLEKTGQDWTKLEKTGQDWTRLNKHISYLKYKTFNHKIYFFMYFHTLEILIKYLLM